jgi:hypothetical protein
MVGCSRMTTKNLCHHERNGIFENDFADEWMSSEPEPLTCSAILIRIIRLCDFTADFIVVQYFDQH